jgi:PST family polysaccharide transporter
MSSQIPEPSGPSGSDRAAAGAIGSAVRAGVAWSTLSFIAAKLVTLVSTLVLTRLLVPSQFGPVAAIVVFLALIELGSDLGMKATVIYEQEGGITERTQTAFTLNLIIAGGLTVAGLLVAPLVARFFHLEHHIWLFRLGTLNVLITALGNVQDGVLLRDMRWRLRIISEVLRAVVRAAVAVGLALAGLGAASLVWGMLAGTAAWTLLLWSMTGMRPTLRLNRSIARNMLGYGTAASALSIIAVISTRVDTAAIGRVLGNTALGLYTVAFQVPALLIGQVASNLSLVAFPALARKRVVDRDGLGPATLKLVRYQTLYALPLAAGMAVLSRPLTNVLFSSKWLPAAGVLVPISLMAAFSSAVFPLGDAFKAVGRQRVLVVLNVIQLPLLVTAIILLAPSGIVAVGWARAGSSALWVALVGVAVARLLAFSPWRMAGAVAPGIAAGLGVVVGAGAVRLLWGGLTFLPLLAGILAGAVGGAVFLRALSPAMFVEVRDQLREAAARFRISARRSATAGSRTDGPASEDPRTEEEPLGPARPGAGRIAGTPR